MIRCLQCGAPSHLVGARFCVQCGAQLPDSSGSSDQVPFPQEPFSPQPTRLVDLPDEVPQPADEPQPTRQTNQPVSPALPAEWVRIKTTAEKDLPAPSAYSYVNGRLLDDQAPQADASQQQGQGAVPESMGEALARVASSRPPTSLPQASNPVEQPASSHRAQVPVPSKPGLAPKRPPETNETLPSMRFPDTSQPDPSPVKPAKAISDSKVAKHTLTQGGSFFHPFDSASKGQTQDSFPKVSVSEASSQSPEDDLSWSPPPSLKSRDVAQAIRIEQAAPLSIPQPSPSSIPQPQSSSSSKRAFETGPDVESAFLDDPSLLEAFEESVDSLLDDIDAGFERIVGQPGSQGAELTDAESKEVLELFAQIAANHMRPVRDFMVEVKLGEPPREWVDLVIPAVASLGKSARGMELSELGAATDVFLEALTGISEAGEPRISGVQAKDLEEAFELLAAELPVAFDLNEERDRREPIIVQSLLRQISDVRKVALDKLYAAGLTSLEMYFSAKAYDIAQAAGLSEELASRIIERFARYRQEVSEATPDLARTREYEELDVLVLRLEEQNAAYHEAALSWSSSAVQDKKRVRKQRNDTVLELNVLLARLGEVDLVKQLEKLPFQAKAQELRDYLAKAKDNVDRGRQ